jgi:hypothetical protein
MDSEHLVNWDLLAKNLRIESQATATKWAQLIGYVEAIRTADEAARKILLNQACDLEYELTGLCERFGELGEFLGIPEDETPIG